MAKPGALCPGVFARITGLTNGTGFNGELASLLRLTETGRWLVKSRGRTMAVRSENLSPAADEVPETFRRWVAAAVAVTAQLFLELARSGGTRQLTTSVASWHFVFACLCGFAHRYDLCLTLLRCLFFFWHGPLLRSWERGGFTIPSFPTSLFQACGTWDAHLHHKDSFGLAQQFVPCS